MNRMTLTASLLLLSGAVFLAPTPTLAQNGGKGKRADRQNQILQGRIARATLKSMAFGDNATIVVTTDDGEELTLKWTNAQFHKDGAPTTPSTFALKNPAGSPVAILYAQSQGSYTLREIWDLASWNAEINKHKGVQTGGISSLNNRVIAFGEFRYALSKDTLWVKGGQRASREDFSVRQTVFVKGDTASGVPLALTVADTAEGANSNALDLAESGLTDGIKPKAKPGKRPKSTGTGGGAGDGDGQSPTESARPGGNGRPQSSGTPYTVRVFFKITDGNDGNEAIGGALGQLGVNDQRVECFGEVRANGQVVWKVERADGVRNKKRTGETLAVLPTTASGMRNGSMWRVSSSTLSLSSTLYDFDTTSNADLLYSGSVNLNLASLAGQGEQVYTSTGGKAELRVVVTR